MIRKRSAAGLVAASALLAFPSTAPAAQAQEAPSSSPGWDVGREHATRSDLRELMARLRSRAADADASVRARDEARRALSVVEGRLEEGDFRVGDRIHLRVEGDTRMNDTLVVRPGPVVHVPVVGPLELRGVLRSELQGHMEDHVSRYVREPRVHAEALIRISVLGAVERPGFYMIPAHLPITETFMLAGGPAGNAHLTGVRVERGNTRIWDGEAMETAIIQGRTIDQMNIQAGDRIVVPRRDDRDWWQRTRVVATALGSVVSLGFVLFRIF